MVFTRGSYREWHKSQNKFELCEVQFVQVETDIWIANLIGQHKNRNDAQGNPPIRYNAIEKGMQSVLLKAKELNAQVHMPRIGCGLAGGKWENIEPILIEHLIQKGIQVTAYDFN